MTRDEIISMTHCPTCGVGKENIYAYYDRDLDRTTHFFCKNCHENFYPDDTRQQPKYTF